MLSNTALFLMVLVPAVLATGFFQPHLDTLIAKIDLDGTRKALLVMSAAHWIFGIGLLLYLTPSDLPSWWDNVLNNWKTVSVIAFQTFLGHRYAQLATWVKKREKRHLEFQRSYRRFSER